MESIPPPLGSHYGLVWSFIRAKTRPISPRTLLALAAFLFSTGGVAIKMVSFPAWQIASIRSGVAFVVLLLLFPKAKSGWTTGSALVGVFYAATMTTFVLANRLTTSAQAVFIQATSPIYLAILAPLILSERTPRRDLLFLIPIITGLGLFLTGEQRTFNTAPNPHLGNLLALVSGFCGALTTIGLRWLAKSNRSVDSSYSALAIGNLMTLAAGAMVSLPWNSGGIADWSIVGLMGIFQIALPYVIVARVLSRVRALEVALVLLLEPVINPILSFLVHREAPGVGVIIGGTIVVGASAIRAWLAARQPLNP